MIADPQDTTVPRTRSRR